MNIYPISVIISSISILSTSSGVGLYMYYFRDESSNLSFQLIQRNTNSESWLCQKLVRGQEKIENIRQEDCQKWISQNWNGKIKNQKIPSFLMRVDKDKVRDSLNKKSSFLHDYFPQDLEKINKTWTLNGSYTCKNEQDLKNNKKVIINCLRNDEELKMYDK